MIRRETISSLENKNMEDKKREKQDRRWTFRLTILGGFVVDGVANCGAVLRWVEARF